MTSITIMKKLVLVLFIIMLPMITSSSQNTSTKIELDSIVLVTPSQLKETNLIFAEHQKLLLENSLLYEQVSNYEKANQILTQADSLKSLQLDNYKLLSKSYSDQISTLTNKLTKKTKEAICWKVGGISVSIGLLVWLLLK